jgi:hypothetical protein
MTIEERHDGTILVTYDSTRLTWLMLAAGIACLATAGYDVFIGVRGTERLPGLLCRGHLCARRDRVPRARVVSIRSRIAHGHMAPPVGGAPTFRINPVRIN